MPGWLRARERILALGGIQACNSYVKINLSLFNLYPRKYTPSIPVVGDQLAERFDPGRGLEPAEYPSVVYVVGGQIASAPSVRIRARPASSGPFPGAAWWQRHRAWIEVFSSAQITKSRSPSGSPCQVLA